MSPESDGNFWDRVADLVGNHYRPHSAEYGVFLFREKLRRRGFSERAATSVDAKLLALAVPWALFLELADREFLRLRRYGWPESAFACFDPAFRLYLGRFEPEVRDTVDERILMARISGKRLADIEGGTIDLHEAFRRAEDGYVLRIRSDIGRIVPVRCADLPEGALPQRGLIASPHDDMTAGS